MVAGKADTTFHIQRVGFVDDLGIGWPTASNPDSGTHSGASNLVCLEILILPRQTYTSRNTILKQLESGRTEINGL